MPKITSSSSPMSLLRALYIRHYSRTTTTTLPSLTKIPAKNRPKAIKQAQEVLTDYLHNTRSLPFTYAELISKNSLFSLSDIMSKVPFSIPKFAKNFRKFLLYNPINEFGFFYESIGINYLLVNGYLKPNVYFFSDDSTVLDAACFLACFGFPWDKLGKLYVEEDSIFCNKSEFLSKKLNLLVSMRFSNQQVVGICLAFPRLLKGDEGELSSEFDDLLSDLKRVFVDFKLESRVEGNVDAWYEVCRKIEVFYGLGIAKGKVGELVLENASILTEFSEKDLVEKVVFFCRLGVEKEEVGMLLLCNPKILSIKIDDRVISVLGFLKHFGLQKKKRVSVERKYKYVLGRNKMVNLPNILRAMDLQEWFFNRVRCGRYQLLADYVFSSPEDDFDESYLPSLEKLKSLRTYSYSLSKLEFFQAIGFPEKSLTLKLVVDAHGSASDLQERFNFLLDEGIEYSKLCNMISRAPKLLNQDTDSLKKKINFVLQEVGLSLDFLVNFPSYFLYNLEDRIKPRYRFHVWLIEQGLCTKKYTLGSIIAVSHKAFIEQLSCIHPRAPQLWLERHGNKKQINEFKGSVSLVNI